MTRREAFELAGKVSAALIVTVAAIGLLVSCVKQHAPQPRMPLVEANAEIATPQAPPQFCASPLPVCRGKQCAPKPVSIA